MIIRMVKWLIEKAEVVRHTISIKKRKLKRALALERTC